MMRVNLVGVKALLMKQISRILIPRKVRNYPLNRVKENLIPLTRMKF